MVAIFRNALRQARHKPPTTSRLAPSQREPGHRSSRPASRLRAPLPIYRAPTVFFGNPSYRCSMKSLSKSLSPSTLKCRLCSVPFHSSFQDTSIFRDEIVSLDSISPRYMPASTWQRSMTIRTVPLTDARAVRHLTTCFRSGFSASARPSATNISLTCRLSKSKATTSLPRSRAASW
jgi:hypothetical protein